LAQERGFRPGSQRGVCAVDCDITQPRKGHIDAFCAIARPGSAFPLCFPANAGEAPQLQELRRHSRSSPLTASQPTRPIHTQEVTGSSPVAPTIHFKQIQTEGRVGCDVRFQFALLDSGWLAAQGPPIAPPSSFSPSASWPCARGCNPPTSRGTCDRRQPSALRRTRRLRPIR
jgi:hypothetical protein